MIKTQTIEETYGLQYIYIYGNRRYEILGMQFKTNMVEIQNYKIINRIINESIRNV